MIRSARSSRAVVLGVAAKLRLLCCALLIWLAGARTPEPVAPVPLEPAPRALTAKASHPADMLAPPLRQVLLVPMPTTAAWQDLAFLAAVPAASAANGGKPVVLAVGADGVLPPEAQDFLRRYHPDRLAWIGVGPEAASVEGIASERLVAESADAAACALATRFFRRSSKVVVVREDDYRSALAGAVLAARLSAPLLFAGELDLSAPARAAIERLGASTLLLVGDFGKTRIAVDEVALERLPQADSVARWLQQHGQPVDYLAAAAPADRVTGHVRKLSLAAAVLAAGRRGAVVPIGADEKPPPDVAAVQDALAQCRTALGATPEFLCLAAMPEALPMAVIPSSEGIDKDPLSDFALGNIDADPFAELAVGRFVAEDGAAGTLLAARSLVYEELLLPAFADRFAMAEWERTCAPLFANVGFLPPAVHAGEKPFDASSALTSVTALVHSSHASWLGLGNTSKHDSRVLLAPCLVESSGCNAAALDQDAEHRSVALRLLRNGAIGFVGNVRRGVAQQDLYRSEFWNGVLAGQSLGQANRSALNRALVSVLANGESERGLRRYQLYNAACYGDPALVLHLPAAAKTKPARVEVQGSKVIVRAPEAWWRCEEFVVPDWKYTDSPSIYTWRGAGVGVECSWDGGHHRNRDILVFTAEVRTRQKVTGLTAVKPPPSPLGWDGLWFVDEHADGSRSVFFRVRMIDFDMARGEVLQQVDSLRFALE